MISSFKGPKVRSTPSTLFAPDSIAELSNVVEILFSPSFRLSSIDPFGKSPRQSAVHFEFQTMQDSAPTSSTLKKSLPLLTDDDLYLEKELRSVPCSHMEVDSASDV